MNVQKRNNDVSIYCLSSGPTLPEWIGSQARRNLSKRDESIRRRIELIQDFQMPAASSCLIQSRDGRYVIVAGTYPPRIRCYDLSELTMKFERYLTAEVVDGVMLGEGYGKFALLLNDRTITFHAPYGAHESIRIPTFGRAISYEPTTCELIVAAKGNALYRIHLEEGRFSVPWTLSENNNINVSATCIAVNQTRPLVSVGCSDGMVRFWDSRMPDDNLKPFLRLDVQSAISGYGYYDDYNNVFNSINPNEIRSVAHDPTGLYMAAGNVGGVVALYDVRSSKPFHIKEHKDGLPIHTIKFHSASGMILTGDEKLIKAWRYKSTSNVENNNVSGILGGASLIDGENFSAAHHNNDLASNIGSVMVNIEGTSNKLTHFIVAGDEKDPTGNQSGVILATADQPKMESFYIPAIGCAPKWCSFLENITEELEEKDLQRGESGAGTGASSDLIRDDQETIYENYKFISRDDIEKLGISNLVGTPLLRGYMHGFFIDNNLYNRVKAVANPFEYEEYRKRKLREKMEAKRSSRIAPRASDKKSNKDNSTTVNPELAGRLQDRAQDSTKAGKVANKLLSDSRFGSLFTNPDFQIDEEDHDFKLRNPSGVAAAKRRRNNLDSDDEDDDEKEEEVGNMSSDEDDEIQQEEEDLEGDNDYDDDDDDQSQTGSSGTDDSDDEEDGFYHGKVRGEAYKSIKQHSNKKNKAPASSNKKKTKKKSQKKVTMISSYEAEELDGASAVRLGLGSDDASNEAKHRLDELRNFPLSKRVTRIQEGLGAGAGKGHTATRVQVRVEGGSKEATFIPRDARRRMEQEQETKRDQGKEKRRRRGVKELGLKKIPF